MAACKTGAVISSLVQQLSTVTTRLQFLVILLLIIAYLPRLLSTVFFASTLNLPQCAASCWPLIKPLNQEPTNHRLPVLLPALKNILISGWKKTLNPFTAPPSSQNWTCVTPTIPHQRGTVNGKQPLIYHWVTLNT